MVGTVGIEPTTLPAIGGSAGADLFKPKIEYKSEFGVDIGGAVNFDALRVLWNSTKAGHAALFDGLSPRVTVRENSKSRAAELRLIAPPRCRNGQQALRHLVGRAPLLPAGTVRRPAFCTDLLPAGAQTCTGSGTQTPSSTGSPTGASNSLNCKSLWPAIAGDRRRRHSAIPRGTPCNPSASSRPRARPIGS
jgi:hypothetical protein